MPVCLSDRRGHPLQLHTGAGSYTLGPPVRIDLYPRTPARIAVGDVTGDGRADIVGADFEYLLILAQRTDRSLAQVQLLQHDFGNPASTVLLDANSDGLFDIVATSGDGFDVFDALGGAHFAAAHHVASPMGWDLQVGDVDSDGRDDLVSPSDQGPELLINDGAGGLRAPYLVADGLTQLGYRLALGDATGDGAPDLVALDGARTHLVVVPNVGGVLASAGWRTIAVSSLPLGGVAVGDITGDGRADLVTQEDLTGGASGARAWLLASTSSGDFAPPVMIAQANYGGRVAIADVNGDGENDVVLLHESSYSVGVLITSHGSLGAERLYNMPTGAGIESLAIGDIDCDGCPDVIVADAGGIVIFAGQGCGP
jgi:hypothetical protein